MVMKQEQSIIVSEQLLNRYGMDKLEFETYLNNKSSNTMIELLDIQYVEITPDKVVMKMPVEPKVHQPFGLLHGGASVVLAETAASMATLFNIDISNFTAVGMEINANHIRSKKKGTITATATPLHKGRRTMVWDIKITDEEDRLICISRCTVAIVSLNVIKP
jgi:1,4-dihydroxy-2-naphthoyl-CoA hydrolase